MHITYVRNAKMTVEILDGVIIDVRNAASPDCGNVCNSNLFQGARLAIVTGVDHGAPDLDFNSPGDIDPRSINIDELIQSKLEGLGYGE